MGWIRCMGQNWHNWRTEENDHFLATTSKVIWQKHIRL